MARKLSLTTAFSPASPSKRTPLGVAGYDNARENIDPHIKTKVIDTSEGIISGNLYFNKSGAGLPFGEIYVADNATGDSIATATTTQFLRFANNGESNLTTPDHAQDHIIIQKTGRYLVNVSFAFSGDASVDWTFHVHTNNGTVEFDNLHTNRKLGAGGDIGSASISGIAQFNAGDTVELWSEHGAGVNKSLTIQDCTLSIIQIGG